MTLLGWIVIISLVLLFVGIAIGKALKILSDDTPCTPPDGDDDFWPYSDDTIGF